MQNDKTNAPSQSRNWVFTLNNHSSVDVPRAVPHTKFVTWQEEIGESGTKHLQGYIIFNNSVRLSALKKIFPTAHWEIRRGTHQEAVDYCNKEESRVSGPWTEGEPPKEQGFRSDLAAVKRAIDSGNTELEIWNEHFVPMAKYYRGIREYKRLRTQENPRQEKTVCIALFGHTGAGKSHTIAAQSAKANWLTKPQKDGVFYIDGYDGHPVVALDEFYGWIPYDTLLRICDKFPLQLPTKGGFVGFTPKICVFTSNKHPDTWYNYSSFSGGYAPLKRRMEYIIEKKAQEYIIHQCPGSVNLDGTNVPGWFPITIKKRDLWFVELPGFPPHLHDYLSGPYPQATVTVAPNTI